ncbi:MAG: hypothetical protein ACYDC6_13590 [Acidobacteriaceae bacterium]
MESRGEKTRTTNESEGGTLLYVTEMVDDPDEALAIDSGLGKNHGRHLELVHVIDLDHTPSSPDAQMGIQYRLDALAAKLRKLKWDVVTMLLFGFAEDKIPKRAKQIKATLIAFRPNNTPSSGRQDSLCASIKRKVSCPVTVLRKHSNLG